MDQTFAAQDMLARVLRETAPRELLVIGDPAPLDPAAAEGAETVATVVDTADALPALERLGRQDLVLVGALDAFPRREGEIVLSRLRDLYARRVVVRLRPGDIWHHGDMTAFGFTRLAQLAAGDGTLYGFDIATYKTTPDWLNPRFWANPELWGQYRW